MWFAVLRFSELEASSLKAVDMSLVPTRRIGTLALCHRNQVRFPHAHPDRLPQQLSRTSDPYLVATLINPAGKEVQRAVTEVALPDPYAPTTYHAEPQPQHIMNTRNPNLPSSDLHIHRHSTSR